MKEQKLIMPHRMSLVEKSPFKKEQQQQQQENIKIRRISDGGGIFNFNSEINLSSD